MIIRYDDGCLEELPIRPLPLRAVGKTREELAAQYGDWKILEFSPELVRVEREGGPCPVHAQLYLGIADSYAAVFQGRPDRGGVVLKKTNVPLRRIPEATGGDCRRNPRRKRARSPTDPRRDGGRSGTEASESGEETSFLFVEYPP